MFLRSGSMGRAKNDEASRSTFDVDKNTFEVIWNIILTGQPRGCHIVSDVTIYSP